MLAALIQEGESPRRGDLAAERRVRVDLADPELVPRNRVVSVGLAARVGLVGLAASAARGGPVGLAASAVRVGPVGLAASAPEESMSVQVALVSALPAPDISRPPH